MEQQSISEVAEQVGVCVDKVLESVRQLGMSFEPRYRELSKDSYIFAHDVIRVRKDLGLLSDIELELQQYKEREYRRESNRLLAGLVLAGAVGLWIIVDNWDHITGFLDGTDPYRGTTLPSLFSNLWSLLRLLATSRVVWGVLAALGVLWVLFGMWWRREHEKWQRSQRST